MKTVSFGELLVLEPFESTEETLNAVLEAFGIELFSSKLR